MNKLSSAKNAYMIMGVMCLVLFAGQSYIFVTKTFCRFLRPFAEHPEIHSYVQDALWDVWLRMLIWPALFFVLLTADLHNMKKDKG